MELKQYQSRVLDDFSRFLETSRAEIPTACIKVPTGGGKTFIATCSIKTILEIMPRRIKIVVWLVPSEAILSQTLAALKNPEHPYRQRLNADFQYRVGVYSKDECLGGENFDRVNVEEQLSILVLSYDSFRGRKESLRSRQPNGNLSSFESLPLEKPIEDAAESSLLQSINRLNPAIIVDESHHAKSPLSLEMLGNFNPSMILELTATPRAGSNIISTVTAAELKRENMVKLPVIVRNVDNRNEVLTYAIEMRRRLEIAARQSPGYIRPIVLLQAQPRSDEESTTFDKLRAELIKRAIPAEQIAIRTADINELRGVDLMSRECPIRYIITINALQEGWDCPFAYILASMANKASIVDVEQIVGRILRLPHSTRNADPNLNESYVLTSSTRFFETLDNIVQGLNATGFGKNDCRAMDERNEVVQTPLEFSPIETPSVVSDVVDDFSDLEVDAASEAEVDVDELLKQSAELGAIYDDALDEQPAGGSGMKNYRVKPEFASDIETLRLPQFVIESREGEWVGVRQSMFDAETRLEKENLEIDFDLSRAEMSIDFGNIDGDIVKIDEVGGKMQWTKARLEEQMRVVELGMTDAAKLERGRWAIINRLRDIKSLSDRQIFAYVERLTETLAAEELERLREFPAAFAECVKKFVDDRLLIHRRDKFFELLAKDRIKCRAKYRMPRAIAPSKSTDQIARSLYEAEASMNPLETKLVYHLTAIDGVRWWHRNISQREFCINGFINHYLDVMIMMDDGRIIFAETKGEHLANDDSAMKARLGRAWQSMAGDRFRYFMVFDDKDDLIDGVVNMSRFLNIIGG